MSVLGPRNVAQAGRVPSGLSSFRLGCLLELSECKGHSGGTRVQNVQASVLRTWCLWSCGHVFLPPHCLTFCEGQTHTACSNDGHVHHPFVWFLCACSKSAHGQRPSVCFVYRFCVISCSKFERKQPPQHGFVELVPCSSEVLRVGNHLRRSQDVASFESWWGHVEVWMEHPTESLSHLVGLPGKRTDPFVGRILFSFKLKNFSCAFTHVFRTPCRCRCYPLLSSSLRRRALQMFASFRKSRQLFGTLRRNHWAVSLQSESLDWSHWSYFEKCRHIFKSHHLASLLQSRLFSWQSCGECGSKLLDCQTWIPFLPRLRYHSNCCQVCRSPKKVNMSTVIDQQDETELPTLSRSQGDFHFQNNIDTPGAEPLHEAASSPEQIAVVEEKMYTGTRNRVRASLFSPRSDEE